MFLPYRDVPASDADRDWVRRQLNQLAYEHHLPHDTYTRFRAAIVGATWRRELQDRADRLTGSAYPTVPGISLPSGR